MQRVLSTGVLLGLLVATAAAFAITEHLKLIKSPIYRTSVSKVVSPVCGCATAKATIAFTLRHPNRVTVTMKDGAGRTVATLASNRHEPKGPVQFTWAPPATVTSGTFRPEVKLPRRTILLPNKIVVDTTPPTVVSASVRNPVFVPGPKRTIAIDYVLGSSAHAIVYLGSKRLILGHPSRPRAALKWNGRVGGRTLPPGRYVISVGAVDLAGNVTSASGRKRVVVVIRPIALSETKIHTRPGSRFAVKVRTAAPSYAWRLAGKHGSSRAKVLHLHAPSKHGRYRLVVSERGHSTSALVLVGRK